MRVIFPMGGTGKRFTDAGYKIPKPFLTINGKTLVEMAINSLGNLYPLVFVCREEYADQLAQIAPKGRSTIIPMQGDTTGPLQTVLREEVSRVIDSHNPILLMDCDSYFTDPEELERAIDVFTFSEASGGVTVRKTDDPSCSYAKIKEHTWMVKETREKDPFTKWSTTGPYWFRSGKEFLWVAKDALRDGIASISPVYNYIIRMGGKVKAFEVKTFVHLGTPEAYVKCGGINV